MKALSLRGRMVLSTFLTTAGLSCVTVLIVALVAYRYLIGGVDGSLTRVAANLQSEYRQFGGLTPEFRHCVDEDVEERDAKKIFILITDADHKIRYATPTPIGFKNRLQRLTARGWKSGRFYTEREDGVDANQHGAIRFVTSSLDDGGMIILAYDVSSIEAFLIFLVATLGGVSFLATVLAAVSSYLVGGRILKLNQLVAEKDAAYSELRHLTDDIAHDLRTPLTRLSMAAEADMTGNRSHEQLSVQVQTETQSMLELINTMLEISQTDAKIDRTPRETIDLSVFVRNACELYAPVLEDAGLTLETHVPTAALPFSGHKGKLQQLLGNLMDNAIKFTPRGGHVEVALAADGGTIRLSVADTGCGIAPADIPFVFKRFWRADSSRHLPGNGLGLALVQAIATSYGGKVACTSEINHGAVFTVTLPASSVAA